MHTSKADLGLMRELNERIVLRLLREEGTISRAELARRSNLSRSTVSSIIAALLAADVVRETGSGSSSGGRRPIMIELNYQSRYVVGVEIGSTLLTLLVTDLAANVLQRCQCSLDIAAGPRACVAHITKLLDLMLSEARIARERLLGVGVGVPGAPAINTGRLITPATMPGWHGTPLGSLLETALGLPVVVENAANLGALAEHRWGAARGGNNIVYLYLGNVGVGCGLILDGRLYRGDSGVAGDIGHLLVQEQGLAHSGGSAENLQAEVGVPALLARSRAQGLPCEQVEDLIRLACQGNNRAVALIEAAGAEIGRVLVSLLNIINPGVVVVGGSLAASGDLLLQPVRATLARQRHATAVDHVAIVPEALGGDVVALGGAAAILQQAFDMPAAVLSSSVT